MKNITPDRWQYYVNNAIHTDEVVLSKLAYVGRSASRFIEIITEKLGPEVIDTISKKMNKQLLKYVFNNEADKIQSISISMYKKLKQ
ncbi:MAG: hypothetical protein ACLFNW_06530 [Desulfobacterales bacterium]